jgi:hypothetical protein
MSTIICTIDNIHIVGIWVAYAMRTDPLHDATVKPIKLPE